MTTVSFTYIAPMFLKKLFTRSRPVVTSGVFYDAVVDTSNYTLIAIGTFGPALKFLSESMMDTEYLPHVGVNDDMRDILSRGPGSFPELSWDSSKRKFQKTKPATVTEELRERAVFAAKKVEAATRAVQKINNMRRRINTGLLFQDVIYAEKERQAQRLKDAHFDADAASTAPYVMQYADAMGMSLKEAAEEILLQASLNHEFLARTEKNRLAMFKKIRLCKTIEETQELINNFEKSGAV